MSTNPLFEKIAECLYLNPSSPQYYALLKIKGKQIKRSLKTGHLPEARRKLDDFRRDQERIDTSAGKVTVAGQLPPSTEPFPFFPARSGCARCWLGCGRPSTLPFL
jgi:hypothetical protein